jgi:hypothetical protein
LAAGEMTNRPPTLAGRLAGRWLSPTITGYGYLALLRRFSDVLTASTKDE